MNIPGTDRPFVVIGENIHTTRVVLRKGKLIGPDPQGVESVRFRDANNKRRFLHIPEASQNNPRLRGRPRQTPQDRRATGHARQ